MPFAPRVFISYSHDSEAHKERVLALANRLRDDGVDVRLDQYETAPKEGWPRWMRRQIKKADAVIVVATEACERRFAGDEGKGEGRGATWEGAIVAQELYDAENVTVVPVVLTEDDLPHVPAALRGFACYLLSAPDGYESLYRHLTGQPEVVAPRLGALKEMPSRSVEPLYADAATRELSEDLAAAYERYEELASLGEYVTAIKAKILDLRRRLREGGHQSTYTTGESIRDLYRKVAILLSEELKCFGDEEAGISSTDLAKSHHQEAVTALQEIQRLLELSFADLGRLFGVSRQAVTAWLARGVPPSQKPKLFTVMNIVELLKRKLKSGRLPAVVRRPAASYGGLSVLQMIEADRHEELLESIRESFNWAATA